MAEELGPELPTGPAWDRSPVEERSHSNAVVTHESSSKWELWLSSLTVTSHTQLTFVAFLKKFFSSSQNVL